MPHARSHKRKKAPKRVLALPDLEHAKSAVLSSLTSRSGQRTCDHAIREFVAWYCPMTPAPIRGSSTEASVQPPAPAAVDRADGAGRMAAGEGIVGWMGKPECERKPGKWRRPLIRR